MVTRYCLSRSGNLEEYISGDYVEYEDYDNLDSLYEDYKDTAEEEYRDLKAKYDDLVNALGDLYKEA